MTAPGEETYHDLKLAQWILEKLNYYKRLFNRSLKLSANIKLGWLIAAGQWVSAPVLVAMAFVVGASIVMRAAGNPFQGHDNIVRVLTVTCTFLALAYVQRSRAHISVSALRERVSPRVGKALDTLNLLLATLIIGVITYVSFPRAWKSFQLGEHSTDSLLAVPLWPAKFAVAIGFALLCAQYFADLVSNIMPLLSRRPPREGYDDILPDKLPKSKYNKSS